MASGKRILFNTIVTYARTIISAGLALFSSRWVLHALGVSDFGLYPLIGSLIVCITFLNSVLAGSASRYFAFDLGRGMKDEVNKWFNTALSIHLFLPLILIAIAYPICIYCIHSFFKIPPERMDACVLVFQISLISTFFGMLSVPYIAMFSAKQQLTELAAVGVTQAVLIFISSYSLLYLSGDKLILYAVFMVSIAVAGFIFQMLRASFKFEECRINTAYWFDKSRFWELMKFSFWNLIGNFGHLVRTQGITMITNLFFGAKANASLGIANQLSIQTSQLTNALSTATAPEIVRSAGLGDEKRAIQVSLQSTKLGLILILLLSVPALTEMDNILRLWLVNPPEHAAILCNLMIFMYIIEKLALGQVSLLQAVNKIAKAQTAVGILFSSSIVLAYIGIKAGLGVQSVGWACVITMLLSRIAIVYYVQKYLAVSIKSWLIEMVLPFIILFAVSYGISYFITYFMAENLYRIILNFAISSLLIGVLSWFFLLSSDDKIYIKSKLLKW